MPDKNADEKPIEFLGHSGVKKQWSIVAAGLYIVFAPLSLYLVDDISADYLELWHLASIALIFIFLAIWYQLEDSLAYHFERMSHNQDAFNSGFKELVRNDLNYYTAVINEREHVRQELLSIISSAIEVSKEEKLVITYFGAGSIIPSPDQVADIENALNELDQDADPEEIVKVGEEAKEMKVSSARLIKALLEKNRELTSPSTPGIQLKRYIDLSDQRIDAYISGGRTRSFLQQFSAWLERQIALLNKEKSTYKMFSSPRCPDFGTYLSVVCSDTEMLQIIGDGEHATLISGRNIVLDYKKSLYEYLRKAGSKNQPNQVTLGELEKIKVKIDTQIVQLQPSTN